MTAQLNKFSLSNLPAELKFQLRMELMQDIVRDGANDKNVRLQSEIAAAERADPVMEFVTKFIVENWLISHGQRMIPDAAVSSSIRKQIEEQNQRRNANLLTRLIDVATGRHEKSRTELIEQNEALAALIEEKKSEFAKAELEVDQAREKGDALIRHASETAAGITTKAQDELNKAREDGKAIILAAERKAADKESESNNLDEEIAAKKNILAELDSNPGVAEAYLRDMGAAEQRIRDEIRKQLVTMKYKFKEDRYGRGSYALAQDIARRLLEGYRHYVLVNIQTYEQKFGVVKRTWFIPELDKEFKEIFGVNTDHSNTGQLELQKHEKENHYPHRLYANSFLDFLSPLAYEENGVAERIELFDSIFGEFISAQGEECNHKSVNEMLDRLRESYKR